MKHKRPAKRLQTCPRCKIGGFVSLAAHRCKKGKSKKEEVRSVDLELVPPPESLKEIEAQLSPVMDRVSRKTEDLLYDLVLAGLFLMKAQLSHRCAPLHSGADGKFSANDDGGFGTWLEEKYPNISRRTAYNYINGANNCGLKVTDGPEAIEALRKAHALKDRTAGDLYKLKDSGGEEELEEQPRGKRWELIRDAAVNFREHSETVVELKPQMNKKVYSTVCARALRTLEELTGSTWDMVDHRHGEPFKEYGDVYDLGS